MLAWKQQGAAVVGAVTLRDGRQALCVLVGPRGQARSAVLVKRKDEPPVPVVESAALLGPGALIEILCMQERVFGDNPELEAPRFVS